MHYHILFRIPQIRQSTKGDGVNIKPAKLKTRTFETADLTIADDSLHWLAAVH